MPRPQQNVVGSQVQRLRVRAGLSQQQLAARCGVIGWDLSRGTLAKIEAKLRCVTDAELFVLARALKQDPKALFPDNVSAIVAALQ